MSITERLPRCFPLPACLEVGNQKWTISYNALKLIPVGSATLTLMLSGPHGRSRRVRVTVTIPSLLGGAVDASEAMRRILTWLPHSDARDVLHLSERDLVVRADVTSA